MKKDLKVLTTILLIYAHLLSEIFAQRFIHEPDGVPCKFHDTVNISDGIKDREDNILHDGLKYPKNMYADYSYIIVNTTSKRSVEQHTRGCVCLLGKPCIRLCLPREFQETDQLDLFVNKSNEQSEYGLSKIENHKYSVVYGKTCNTMFEVEPGEIEGDEWIFLKNGSVKMANGFVAHQHEYCMTTNSDDNSTSDESPAILHLCFFETVQLEAAFPIGMLISVPFLLVTLLVYGLIPELRNLHGKCLMCYVFGLSVLYISLSLVQLEKVHHTICTLTGFIVYISVLWCFAWLNVMCYDIWSVFKGVRGSRGNVERTKFILYSLYAFGICCAMATLVALMDNLEFVSDKVRPGMGLERCWLRNDRNIEMLYVYLPISIILCVNVTLYSITAYKIFTVQKETSVVRKGESQKHSKNDADRERFYLYLRLFVVMGVTWVMESVSWAFKGSIIFYLTDILNCLQGLIIFFLFLWKPKVKTLIIKRYRVARKLPPRMSMMGSTRTDNSRISSMTHTAETKLLKDPCSFTST